LADRENEWGRQAQIQRQETYDNQLAIIKYQTKMLEQQEFVVAQTKRDNTVMKVIAILTALFLPGTFIAVRKSSIVLDFSKN
jgi:Mg2+ and Co2+ transporter CorA